MLKKYSFFWVTLVLFLGSLIGHWVFSWYAYVGEQQSEQRPIDVKEYWTLTARDTLENWQSEFLQLIWQVGGLSYLLYVGSPQSKEGDERKELKLDEILRSLNPEKAEKLIQELDSKFPRK